MTKSEKKPGSLDPVSKRIFTQHLAKFCPRKRRRWRWPSPTLGHAEALANKYGIPRVFRDYREMLREKDIEMITITAPNSLHAQMTRDIANAGKHVVCEKPLCMTLEQADRPLVEASGVTTLNKQ